MHALHAYLLEQLRTACACLRRIDLDADPEILHQYRVCLRRSVSLLKLYRHDCPWRKPIKRLLGHTNAIRELDVLLMSIDPVSYPKLHRRLKRYRDKRFARELDKSWCAKSLQKLERLLREISAPDAKKRFEPLHNDRLVRKALKIHADSIRRYERIAHDAPSEAFHRLRIRFKISRYALAFLTTGGLYNAANEIERVKRIQDRLGLIQDMTNQIDVLKRFCEKTNSPGCETLIREREEAITLAKQERSV